jgi:hypothetical protein
LEGGCVNHHAKSRILTGQLDVEKSIVLVAEHRNRPVKQIKLKIKSNFRKKQKIDNDKDNDNDNDYFLTNNE